jgi:hypothetical protein
VSAASKTLSLASPPTQSSSLPNFDLDLLLNRLRALQNVTPVYERYLRTFSDQMTATGPWPGIRSTGLPADASLGDNVSFAGAWISTMRMSCRNGRQRLRAENS